MLPFYLLTLDSIDIDIAYDNIINKREIIEWHLLEYIDTRFD